MRTYTLGKSEPGFNCYITRKPRPFRWGSYTSAKFTVFIF